MKKKLSLALALVMALSLAVPAFAADKEISDVNQLGEGASTQITGSTKAPTIKITVPTAGAVLLNPYKMSAKIPGVPVTIAKEDITGIETLTIAGTENFKTPVAKGVYVEVTKDGGDKVYILDGAESDSTTYTTAKNNAAAGTDGSGKDKVETVAATVADVTYTPAPTGDAKTDQVLSAPQFITSQSDVPIKVGISVTGTPSDTLTLATAAVKDTETKKTAFVYFEIAKVTTADTAPTWGTYDTKAVNMLAVKKGAATKANVVELDAVDVTDASKKSQAAFHLAGNAAESPTSAWTSSDKLDVTVAFTFTPGAAAKSGS